MAENEKEFHQLHSSITGAKTLFKERFEQPLTGVSLEDAEQRLKSGRHLVDFQKIEFPEEELRKLFEDFCSVMKGFEFHEVAEVETLKAAVDFKAKAGVFGLSGEWFMGSNLRMLFSNAHVYTELNVVGSDTTFKVKGVEVTGGWGQISLKPQNTNLTFNTGVGTEILKEEHVDPLATVGGSQLWKNLTFFANVMAKPMGNVTIAFEYCYLKTTYKYWDATAAALAESDAHNSAFNLVFKFDF